MALHDRTHTASRHIPVDPPAVYAALIDPQSLAQWLPPEGATCRIGLFEPRPGGLFKMTLTFASHPGKSSSDTDEIDGQFVELVPGERVVQAIAFHSDDPAFSGVMKMTWRLTPEAGGTRVTIVADNVPTGISRQDHEAGLASTLDNLARFIQ